MLRSHRAAAVAALTITFALTTAAGAADEVPPAAAAAEGVSFEAGTPAFADVLAKAKEANKPAFIDFSTTWCGWCRKLEKDTFSQDTVGAVMKGFVNVHVDAEKGEGPALAKRYAVHGFPTLVVVNAAGDEIDRIVGYMPPEPFAVEMKRILSGEGTLLSLRTKFAASPDDVDAGIAYGAKLGGTQPAEAATLLGSLLEKAKTKGKATQSKAELEYASVLLATKEFGEKAKAANEAINAKAMATAEMLVRDFADTPAAGQAASRLGRAFSGPDTHRALAFLDTARDLAKEPKDRMAIEQLAVGVYATATANAYKAQAEAAGDDAQALNEIAWKCFELKINTKDAVGWARKAVEKSKRDGAILDTLANLLWVSGAGDEAIKTEEEAAEKAEGTHKAEFVANVTKWRAEQEKRAAAKAAADAAKAAKAAKAAADKPADGAAK